MPKYIWEPVLKRLLWGNWSTGGTGGGTDPGGAIPTNGLVFHFSGSSAAIESGQPFTTEGTVSHTTNSGINCAYIQAPGNYMQFEDSLLPAGTQDFTVSAWVKRSAAYEGVEATFFAWGLSSSEQQGRCVELCLSSNGRIGVDKFGAQLLSPVNTIDHTAWNNIILVHTSGNTKVYVNGALTINSSYVLNPLLNYGRIGTGGSNEWPIGTAWIASCRVWSRVLNDTEIASVYAEHSA